MDFNAVTETMRADPAVAEAGREHLEAVLSRSATDPGFRARLLADPRSAISTHLGREISAEAFPDVVFIENRASATIVLPDFAGPDTELSESELEAVAGGEILLLTAAVIGVLAVGVALGSAINESGQNQCPAT